MGQALSSLKALTHLNLREQLTFYGSYHNKPVNQLIHFVFVPTILWSVAAWLAYTPSFGSACGPACTSALPAGLHSVTPLLQLNGSAALLGAYALYYTLLEPVAGASWGLAVGVPLWAAANAFKASVPGAWAWTLGVHILSWFMQIVPGHAWAEGRKPALLDSFFQSLVLAPLFVWFELLFHLGYRPALRKEVAAKVDTAIAAHRAASAQGPARGKES